MELDLRASKKLGIVSVFCFFKCLLEIALTFSITLSMISFRSSSLRNSAVFFLEEDTCSVTLIVQLMKVQ